jgi:hypothetical protein
MLVISDVFSPTYMVFDTSNGMRRCDSNGQSTTQIWIVRKFRIFYFNSAGERIDAVVN